MKLMKIEKRIFWILALCMGYSLAALADNEINIEQTGDNLDLEILQVGADNIIKMKDNDSYINMSSLDIWMIQYNIGGNENQIVIDEMSGSGNDIKLAQGVAWDSSTTGWNYDGFEGGGHYMEIDLYGNNNEIEWHQTNQSGALDGHNFYLHVAGSDNSIDGRQQSSGAKDMELTLYNSYNNVYNNRDDPASSFPQAWSEYLGVTVDVSR